MIRIIKLGDITFLPHQMIPSFEYSENPVEVAHNRRSSDGTFRSQRLFIKFRTTISGIAIGDFPELKREFEKETTVNLSSIKKREETLSGDGAAVDFFVTRQTRLDAGYEAVVEHPAGTVLDEGVDYSIANVDNGGTLQAKITFVAPPASGSDNIVVTYFPILVVYVVSCTDSWGEWRSESTWQIVCEEA